MVLYNINVSQLRYVINMLSFFFYKTFFFFDKQLKFSPAACFMINLLISSWFQHLFSTSLWTSINTWIKYTNRSVWNTAFQADFIDRFLGELNVYHLLLLSSVRSLFFLIVTCAWLIIRPVVRLKTKECSFFRLSRTWRGWWVAGWLFCCWIDVERLLNLSSNCFYRA